MSASAPPAYNTLQISPEAEQELKTFLDPQAQLRAIVAGPSALRAPANASKTCPTCQSLIQNQPDCGNRIMTVLCSTVTWLSEMIFGCCDPPCQDSYYKCQSCGVYLEVRNIKDFEVITEYKELQEKIQVHIP